MVQKLLQQYIGQHEEVDENRNIICTMNFKQVENGTRQKSR